MSWCDHPSLRHRPESPFLRADLLDRCFPPQPRAGRPNPAWTAVRADAAGVNPQGSHHPFRPVHARGSIAIPIAVFTVTLLVLRRWWQ